MRDAIRYLGASARAAVRCTNAQIEPAPSSGPPEAASVLTWLAKHAVDSPGIPRDLSHQHDHYLYGVPKKDA